MWPAAVGRRHMSTSRTGPRRLPLACTTVAWHSSSNGILDGGVMASAWHSWIMADGRPAAADEQAVRAAQETGTSISANAEV